MKLYLGGTMVCKKSDYNKVYMTVSDKIKTKANVQLHWLCQKKVRLCL